MLSKAIAVLAAATLTSAATPMGFMPSSNTPLIVSYGGISALDGVNLPKDCKLIDGQGRMTTSQVQPTIATEQQLKGQYAIIMVDIDVPTNQPPKTGTLLHWMQTGLMSADTPVTLNTTAGPKKVFVMQNRMNAAALAPYIGPNPPAREPLSHRYTFVAVDHTTITQQGLMALSGAAQNRRDFNVMNGLMAAGLQDKVVAGNFFRVTNPGPVGAGQGMPGGGSGGNSTGGGGAPMQPMPMPTPTGGTPTTPGGMPGMPGMPNMPGMSMTPGMTMPMPGMPAGTPGASAPPIGGAQPSAPARASAPSLNPGLGVVSMGLCLIGTLFVLL
ncbi:phosphatidylethanolamine-binding protein PEBP [Colletotrichum tofieldiae]|uniref:Phosphatidylethanolamine-binding protein PEBP n=1 Tax=Colletotrichum tofieldiae TaxID=708197 RepID=A0A166RKP3_9PEZI|nr:phosphatidylethanolamine-binding protein PEBP [Colletotrichum tofieldiae]GKT84824.1 phosphatidylethanolamine-binding protein PEBP [Colletotrichum tofieldiae]